MEPFTVGALLGAMYYWSNRENKKKEYSPPKREGHIWVNHKGVFYSIPDRDTHYVKEI